MIACVDLFCGLGGLTHGLLRGGVRVVAGIDLDAQCQYPYEGNNSAAFIRRDVHDLSGGDLRGLWGDAAITLLAGCAPCQSFSTYSRKGRRERKDSKWELVAEFGRLVRESKPDLVTMENVPQLLDHKVFSGFLTSLSDYYVWYQRVSCEQYQVPQTRKRLVLLASRFGPIELAPADEFEGGAKTVREAIGHLRPLSAGESDPNDRLHAACRLSPLNLRRIKASKPGGTWREWPEPLVAKCHKRLSGGTYPSVYGRMDWNTPAPTITTQCFGYGNGRFGHPDQHRAITLREAAILQTFPESYSFLRHGDVVKFSVLGRLIGNAVPVRLGEVIAQTLRQHVVSCNDTVIMQS